MTDRIDLGTFKTEHCTAEDDAGVIRVCNPNGWVLWLFAIWNGVAHRTSPYGVETWEVRPIDTHPDTAYFYNVVKNSPLGVVE